MMTYITIEPRMAYRIRIASVCCLCLAMTLSTGCTSQGKEKNNGLINENQTSLETQQDSLAYDASLPLDTTAKSDEIDPLDDKQEMDRKITADDDTSLEPQTVRPIDTTTTETESNVVPVDEAASVSTDATPVLDPSQPSLTGLDRSSWPLVATGPDNGKTHHYPFYFSDWLLDPTDSTIHYEDEIEVQLEAAMDNQDQRALSWHQANAVGFIVQPAKFAVDLPLLMIRLVYQPFWKDTTTP